MTYVRTSHTSMRSGPKAMGGLYKEILLVGSLWALLVRLENICHISLSRRSVLSYGYVGASRKTVFYPLQVKQNGYSRGKRQVAKFKVAVSIGTLKLAETERKG